MLKSIKRSVSKVTHSGIFDKMPSRTHFCLLQPIMASLICVGMLRMSSFMSVLSLSVALLLGAGSHAAALDSTSPHQSVSTSVSDLPAKPTVSTTASACPQNPYGSNTINIKLDMPEPKINHSKSRYDLQDFNVSTKSPYGKGGFTHVNGLMRGPMELSTKLMIAWQNNPDNQENCFWYQSINLTLKLRPVIFVANEIRRDTCYYNAIVEHEMKHVEVDRGLLRDYQNIIYDTIDNYVRQHGMVDNIPTGQEKEAQAQLSQALEDELRKIHARMHEERIQRQAQIDNVKEYDRVSDQCTLQERLDN
jgi:hypothetical protein